MTDLRIQLTSFIGRGAELELADELLSEHRLVTLTGPGGAGKTRLAAQAAAGREERCPDGIWWVDLSTVGAGVSVGVGVGASAGGGDGTAVGTIADTIASTTGRAGTATAVAEAVAEAVAVLETRRGDLKAAIPWLRRAAASTDGDTATWIAGTALPALGAALAGSGLRDEAATVLDTALAVTRRLGLPGPLAQTYAAQAELAAAEPDGATRAVELRHAALSIHVDHHLLAFQPDDLEALVRYGAATRPTLDDVRILHASQAARAAMGLPRTTRADEAFEATADLLRESVGDAAFEEAAQAGALLPLDQAVARARRARGSRGRPATGWPSLTPTEREVVGLVAEGLTNPQIAARLFMSRGTVKTHLSHVFAKLGTANRTELAAAVAAAATQGGAATQREAAR